MLKVKTWCAALLLGAGIGAAANEQPNILLLVAEDLSPRIGAYGDDIARTPHLDKLAASGIRFTLAFTTAGVCAPSRAALITGQHQISFGGQHMRTSTSPLGMYLAQPDQQVRAFPEILRAHGYYTFTDRKLDYQFSGIRAGSGPFTLWDEEDAEDTAWRNRANGQPFFGLINFMETHESGVMRPDGPPHSAIHAATQKMRAAISSQVLPVTAPQTVKLPPYWPDLPSVRQDLARHYDNIHHMDKRVGQILAALEGDGLRHNTIVIWTTDHGDGLPRSKREVYDSGTRVPLLVSQPGIAPGVDRRLVSFVDFAPTLLSWAGIQPPDWLHGVVFTNHDVKRQYIYASRDRIDEVADRQRSVRDKRFRYIRSWYPEVPGGHVLAYRDNLDMVRTWRASSQQGKLNSIQNRWFEGAGENQLYDLHTDPHETHNLAADAAHSMTLLRLRKALEAFIARVGDTSNTPEAELRERFLDQGSLRRTPPPLISDLPGGLLRIVSPIGASIGFRHGQSPWQLYTRPIPAAALEAKSVRYGWAESETVSYEPK